MNSWEWVLLCHYVPTPSTHKTQCTVQHLMSLHTHTYKTVATYSHLQDCLASVTWGLRNTTSRLDRHFQCCKQQKVMSTVCRNFLEDELVAIVQPGLMIPMPRLPNMIHNAVPAPCQAQTYDDHYQISHLSLETGTFR